MLQVTRCTSKCRKGNGKQERQQQQAPVVVVMEASPACLVAQGNVSLCYYSCPHCCLAAWLVLLVLLVLLHFAVAGGGPMATGVVGSSEGRCRAGGAKRRQRRSRPPLLAARPARLLQRQPQPAAGAAGPGWGPSSWGCGAWGRQRWRRSGGAERRRRAQSAGAPAAPASGPWVALRAPRARQGPAAAPRSGGAAAGGAERRRRACPRGRGGAPGPLQACRGVKITRTDANGARAGRQNRRILRGHGRWARPPPTSSMCLWGPRPQPV